MVPRLLLRSFGAVEPFVHDFHALAVCRAHRDAIGRELLHDPFFTRFSRHLEQTRGLPPASQALSAVKFVVLN